jgi:hypothetical protein
MWWYDEVMYGFVIVRWIWTSRFAWLCCLCWGDWVWFAKMGDRFRSQQMMIAFPQCWRILCHLMMSRWPWRWIQAIINCWDRRFNLLKVASVYRHAVCIKIQLQCYVCIKIQDPVSCRRESLAGSTCSERISERFFPRRIMSSTVRFAEVWKIE